MTTEAANYISYKELKGVTATTVCDNQELEVVEEEALAELVPCQQSPTHPKQATVVCPAASFVS